jgi:hypothetical protein
MSRLAANHEDFAPIEMLIRGLFDSVASRQTSPRVISAAGDRALNCRLGDVRKPPLGADPPG